MRQPWTEEEVQFVREHPTDWEAFHAEFPTRTYDSWEVKRRRLGGGSAGSRVRLLEADLLAQEMLAVLERYTANRVKQELRRGA